MSKQPYFTMSVKQDWTTPPEFIEWAVKEGIMQRPTFDVAAAPHNAKADQFFTKEDDALQQPWPSGILWCNPPYGKELKLFIRKALNELWTPRHYSEHTEVWFMIPARTDTGWFHDLVWPNAENIYFIRGRMNLLEHGKSKKSNATFPTMLVQFLGPHSYRKFNTGQCAVTTIEPPLHARGRGK